MFGAFIGDIVGSKYEFNKMLIDLTQHATRCSDSSG